ncbi:hypothetical protein FDF74_08155 [Clostridium niameyense]|uniref:BIG2 domain-containing protein n=1 Tax=Clostridium niameyense TaxID=1622073 RepID=A0A6M0RA98_9CLOT|nr:cell wall-binding repeat-containing protein [Clostridium niameyense]NEZ47181.1 hypothetical protein [Clostridium niameyense]
MNKKSTRALASATVVGLVLTTAISTGNVQAAPGKVDRLHGANRYETASKVATSNWKAGETKNVILVSGEGYADALSASLLAQKLDAPVLLTGKDNLDVNAKNAINKLGAKNVYILGSKGVVSENIKSSLENEGKTVKRLAGKDRYETNIAIANELVSNHGVSAKEVLVVNGNKYLADALTAAPVAAKEGKILLLVGEDESTANEAKKFIDAHSSKVTVIGRDVTVSDVIYNKLGASKRVKGGADRFETNRLVLDAFNMKGSHLYIANGQNDHLVDSLVASALAGKFNSPVVLVSNDKEEDAKAIKYMKDELKINDKTDLNVVGSEAILSDDLVKDIDNVVTPQSEDVVAAEKAVKAYETAKLTNAEEIKAAKELKVEAVKTVKAVKDEAKKVDFEKRIAVADKKLVEAEAKLGISVGTVSAITKTEVTIVLAKKPAVDLTADKFVVKANGTDVKVEKIAKVDSDLTGKTYKLTINSLDKTEGKLTVNGTEKAFDFKAPEVKGIEVKDANHIVVNFNEELNEASLIEANFKIKKVAENVKAASASKVVLNADKKSVTVTLGTALVPADYVLSLGVAGGTTVQDIAKNGIYAGTEVSFRPTAAQLENKVAPALAKGTYNKGTGILSLTFDKNILDSKLDVTKLSINGVALTAADTVDTKTTADDNIVEIKLGEVSKRAVNALEGDLKLTVAKDAYGIADKLTDGETFAIAKEEPAVVKSATYNQETNVLTVTFDQPVAIVEASQADGQTLLSLNVEGGALQTVQANNIVGDRTLTQATWKFDLGVETHNVAGDVEGLANVSSKLKVYTEKDIFVNAAKVKNTDAQNDYEKGIAVAYTKDEKKPSITGVEFNNKSNELTIKFSEKVTLEAGANFIIDTDEDETLRSTIAQAKFAQPDVAKDTFVAKLDKDLDKETIKTLNDLYATGKDLKLTVAKEVITDTNNLKNDVVDFAHGINVVFHDYVRPKLDGVIKAETPTKVKVVFDEKVDKISAEKVANYVIKDSTGAALKVTGAQLQADGKTVYLTTVAQTSGKPYDVTVANVKDLQGNIMIAAPGNFAGNGIAKDDKLKVSALEAKAVKNDKDTLKVKFSEKVNPAMATNLGNYAVLAKGIDAKYEDAKAVSLAGATAKIDPEDASSVIITLADRVNILNTKEYKVIVNNVKDVYGNELDATKVSTTDVADGDVALSAPKVIINQLDGKDNDTVTLVFDEQLNPETVVKGNFTVDGKSATGVATSWDAKKKEYTVTLQTGADFTSAKAVVIKKEVVDLAGNAITAGADTTIAAGDVTLKDSVKPTVSKIEAKAVSDGKDTITVEFDKDLVEASAKVLANYTLTDEAGKEIDLKDATIAYANKVATITLPDGSKVAEKKTNEVNLLHGKNYTVTVANVVDTKGNTMNKVTKTVTWAEDSDKEAPTYTVKTDAGKSTVTLTFNEKIDLSKVDLSTFTIKYDADKDDAKNELTKLKPIYVTKADDSKAITITLDNKVKAAEAGKTAMVTVEINEGKDVCDFAGNKAAHDAVKGNDMVTAPAVVNVKGITVTGGAANAKTITKDKGTLQMSAAVTPDTATNKEVKWSVVGTDNNPTDLATISEAGLLKAAKDGKVKVVATAKDGSGIKGEVQITISNQVVADTKAPTYTDATIDSTKKIVTLTFDENVENNLTDIFKLKKAIKIATDGSTYSDLGTNDKVKIQDKTIVITFENALAGDKNKIKVAKDSLKDKAGNVVDADVETNDISAN